MDADRSGLEVLSRDECLRLLSGARTGRVGFHAGALPVVLPVAFAVDDLAIVVGVRPGSQLDDATRDAVVAFEADDVDPGVGTAWSVSVTGVTSDITDPTELARVRSLGLDGWAGGATGRFKRISTDLISGRRRDPGHGPAGLDQGGPAGAAAPAGVADTRSGVVPWTTAIELDTSGEAGRVATAAGVRRWADKGDAMSR